MTVPENKYKCNSVCGMVLQISKWRVAEWRQKYYSASGMVPPSSPFFGHHFSAIELAHPNRTSHRCLLRKIWFYILNVSFTLNTYITYVYSWVLLRKILIMINDHFGSPFLSHIISPSISDNVALPMTDTLSDPTQLSDKNNWYILLYYHCKVNFIRKTTFKASWLATLLLLVSLLLLISMLLLASLLMVAGIPCCSCYFCCYFVKVLSSEMDQAEIRLIR
jgi:hypothetical protein